MLRSKQIENELFYRIFDIAPDPILIVDAQGKIVRTNQETEHRFGYQPGELTGQKLEILVPDRYGKHHVKYRDDYTKSPVLRPMGTGRELYAKRKSGEEFPVEISLSPMPTPDGNYVIAIVRDITDRKNVERDLKNLNLELNRSNKELEEFAYIASHDLQEPLRSVAGSCQLLRRRYGDKLDKQAMEFIDFAVAGAKRMEELINDLLTYSRVSTNAKELETVALDQVIQDVISNLRTAISDSGAEVTSDPLPSMKLDPWQVGQLFQNLIANSLKFHGTESPKVHISAVETSGTWEFAVRDNGIGIDPKYFDRIFVVFKRLHSRDEYPGTGIGLASCKKIVERHGGTIWVESTVGRGTTFRFTLSPPLRNRT